MEKVHFNQLSPAEAERLAVLAEECGEVIQVIGKILRHGYESCHPNGGPTNRSLLTKELGDLACAEGMLFQAHDVSVERVDLRLAEKRSQIRQFLHHQDQPQLPTRLPDPFTHSADAS